MRLTSQQQELLKYVAVLLMVLDHLAAILLGPGHPAYMPPPMLGRISFPLFAFLFAYNLQVRQVKATAYIVPLALAALVSQPAYAWATGWPTWNIFFTLLAGVLVWHVLNSEMGRFFWVEVAGVAVFVVSVALNGEYGLAGVALVFAWALVLDKHELWRIVLLGVALVAVNWGTVPIVAVMALSAWAIVVLAQRVPGIPRLRQLKWFWYAFYPLHLVLFAVIL